jgi:prefoldin subunit 5
MGQTTTQRIESIQTQIQELEKQQKQLLQRQKESERKARTHRICKRGGEIEKLLPGIETLTEDEFKAFANITFLTPYSKKELAKILANKAVAKPVEAAVNPVQEREDSSLVLTQTLTVRNAEGGEIAPEA